MLDGDSAPTKSLTFDVATASIKGTRDYQDDTMISSFPVGQGSGFAIIADGMGGHVAGHLASALVTTEVFCHLKMQEGELESGALNVPFALREATDRANEKVAEHIRKDDSTKGMGSTLLVPVIRGDRLSWISIGDSPLYLFRDGALRQLNKDHSMAPQIDMMVKTGSLSPEAGKDHPDRNILMSVINGEDIAQIDAPTTPIRLKEGDILVAASDGLQTLSNAIIANTLMHGTQGPSIDIVDTFLAELKAANSEEQDNATFAVIKIVAKRRTSRVLDLDDMPVLAQAETVGPAMTTPVAVPEPVAETPAPALAPEPEAEPEKDERKAYYYRGQKYYRD